MSHIPPPPIGNLNAWFDYYDRDRNGSLDINELVYALIESHGATTLAEQQNIREIATNIFPIFDMDQSGSIEKKEFLAPGGLGENLSHSFSSSSSVSSSSSNHTNHHQQQQQPNEQNKWACSMCSFHNYNGKTNCSMCGTSRQQQQPCNLYTETSVQPPPPFNPHAASPSFAANQPHQSYNPFLPPPPSAPFAPLQQQQQQYQIKRAKIPNGMQPGQQLRVQISEGKLFDVQIPERRYWTMPPPGSQQQPSFQFRVEVNPSAQQLQEQQNYPARNNHHHPQQQEQHQTRHQEPWQSYDYFQPQRSSPNGRPMGGSTTLVVPVPSSLPLIRASGRYRALIIGINYTGTRAALRGCINDAKNIQRLLLQSGYPNDTSHMVMLTDEVSSSSNYQPTSLNIFKAMQWLLQGISHGDILFFHFSGHGAQVPDPTGQESDGLNETILPLDYKKNLITDDELWNHLVYPLPNGSRLTAIMDCCHSGTGLDLPYEHKLNQNNVCPHYNNHNPNHSRQWMEEINPAHSQGDVILLSGCEDSQTSADTSQKGQAGGAMTQSFITAYEQAKREKGGIIMFPELLRNLHTHLKNRGFKQRPQLTSSQPFDVNNRIFSLIEGIEANHNPTIGRIKRKHIKPSKQPGGAFDIEDILFGGGNTFGKIAAVGVGAALLGALFD